MGAETSVEHARRLDEADALREHRDLFEFPRAWHDPSRAAVYLVGNSLGLMPKAAREMIGEELEDWARLGVEAHLHGRRPWYSYHEMFREPLANLVGARPIEVVAMNSLTVNEHLMMVSFYRPTASRHRILIEDNAFPSDSYAVQSQIRFHGYDPREALVRMRPREGEHALRTEDVVELIEREGKTIALVLFGGVNFRTGEWMDMEAITAAGRRQGCVVGWDLAHAAGNVPLRLHDWGCDFAVWCSYKYLNGGPGAVGGAFVHERHARDERLPRFAGWWGNDPATRFEMSPEFQARAGADGWQLSNPPILSMTALKASLDIFERAGMGRLREKSVALTAYMEKLLIAKCGGRIRIATPREASRRGCQLSILVEGNAERVREALLRRGVVCDARPPNVIRAAPVPLYNSFEDVHAFVMALADVLGG